MFTTESENRFYALKPMNCAGHIQLFNSALRSYRDLPMRFGEFGQCHRNEPSSSLHGLMRVRGFTQDDGHIFCSEDQILSECVNYTRIVREVYKTFGFTDISYKIATRPEMRIGEDSAWDKAEAALIESLKACGVPYDILPGEGAFYGPKIEYHLKDCLGRSWQCGTIQLDMQLPERFELEYTGADGAKHRPVMIHRVVFGSIERFIGVITEHFAGAFPTWLAPVQVKVMAMTDRTRDAVCDIAAKLEAQGLRVETDLRNEKIGFKIREAQMQKIPYMLIVGDKEVENGVVAVRARKGGDLGTMTLDAFEQKINEEVASKTLD